MYMYATASTTGNRGIYVTAHGTGAAKSVFVVDTNNYVTGYFNTLYVYSVLVLPTSASTTNNSIWIG